MRNKAFLLILLAFGGFVLVPAHAHADVPSCAPAAVEIASPTDGTTLEGSPAKLEVELEVTRGDMLSRVALMVDGSKMASTDVSEPGKHALSIELAPGTHTLQAVVEDLCAGSARSDAISVEVSASASSVQMRAEPAEVEPTKGAKGCAVSRTPDAALMGIAACSLALFGAWRLRRADR
jgi:hypothetical protein